MNSTAATSPHEMPPVCGKIYRGVFVRGEQEHVTPEVYAAMLSIVVVAFVTLPFTVVLNLLVMIAVKTKPRLQTTSSVMVACLASTDFLVGVFVQPLFIAGVISALPGYTSTTSCILRVIMRDAIRFFCGASMFHLILMTGERCFAIFHPYTYTATVTKGRLLTASALAWVATLVILGLHLVFGEDILQTSNNPTLVLLVLVIIIGQFVLYGEARRHEKKLSAQQVSVEARQNFLKEKKALQLTTYVVFAVLFFYSPMVVVRIVISKVSLNVAYILFGLGGFVPVLNSFANPIIYAVRIRQFRVAFVQILLKKNFPEAQQIEMRFFGSRNAVSVLQQRQEQDTSRKQMRQETS